MTRRQAIDAAEAELAAALEHTDACQERYDGAPTPENDALLNAAYDAEIRAREALRLAETLAPRPLGLHGPRGDVLA